VYLSHEVQMHQRVLQTVVSLTGQTHNPQLTEIAAGARPSWKRTSRGPNEYSPTSGNARTTNAEKWCSVCHGFVS
jgi:hypothetical protein